MAAGDFYPPSDSAGRSDNEDILAEENPYEEKEEEAEERKTSGEYDPYASGSLFHINEYTE